MSGRIEPLICRYRFKDAMQSVYCINSWYKNRPAQGCAMALNAALLSITEYGDTSIGTYEEFTSFFHDLQKLCIVSPREDYVLPVMGQTKIEFHDMWWDALYGCGATQEYPRLSFADAVCTAAGKEDEFESLLRYVGAMSEALDGGGWDAGNPEEIGFYLPSESHWRLVREWLASGPTSALSQEVIDRLGERNAPVEQIHFMERDACMPLFNASILSDYFKECCSLVEEHDYQGAVDYALLRQAESSFFSKAGGRESMVAYPCFKVDGRLLDNCPATFALLDDTPSMTLFYNLSLGDGNLENVKEVFATSSNPLDIIEGLPRGGCRRGFTVPNPSRIKFTLIAYVDSSTPASTPLPILKGISQTADMTCGSVDVMALLQMASSIEELNTFFLQLKMTKNRFVQPFSAFSDLFAIWKDNDRNILSGAEDNKDAFSIYFDFNETDHYYRKLFHETLGDYPFIDRKYILGSPFSCDFDHNERGFLAIKLKSNGESLGVTKRLGGGSSFIHIHINQIGSESLSTEQLEAESEAYLLMQDLFMCLANDAEAGMGRFASSIGGLVRIEYVTETEADASQLDMIDSRIGVRGALLNEEGFPLIRIAIDTTTFFKVLMESTDRGVECDLAIAAFSLFPSDDGGVVQGLLKEIERLRHQKKIVDVKTLELPYRWIRSTSQIAETDVSKARALKAVAIAADDADVQAGTYYGIDANAILRGFQQNLAERFKGELNRFKTTILIEHLYEIVADSSHEFYLQNSRFGSFEKLRKDERDHLNSSAMSSREDARYRTRAARYCIETTLSFELGGTEVPNDRDLSFLISLAVQMIGINDDADMLYFEPLGIGISIEGNHLISLIEDEDTKPDSKLLKMRQLLDPGHLGSEATKDASYISQAKAAFARDTGISFDCYISVLDTLAKEPQTEIDLSVQPNVVAVGRDRLDSILSESLGKSFDSAELASCTNFLIIAPSSLRRTIDGREYDYLPTSREKNRPNRLELKPMVELDGRLIFSPVSMGMLRRRWLNGIADRFIPAKAAFKALSGVMKQWKQRYEKALESDVRDCFLNNGFDKSYVFKGLELKKHGGHPSHLGDYDVLAYDEGSETIWAIECKEFEKVDSTFDYMQLQQRWFGEEGVLEKFERRIRYLRERTDQVAADLSFPHGGSIKIRALLVSNKIFINMLNESNFDVVSLNELNNLLSNV